MGEVGEIEGNVLDGADEGELEVGIAEGLPLGNRVGFPLGLNVGRCVMPRSSRASSTVSGTASSAPRVDSTCGALWTVGGSVIRFGVSAIDLIPPPQSQHACFAFNPSSPMEFAISSRNL